MNKADTGTRPWRRQQGRTVTISPRDSATRRSERHGRSNKPKLWSLEQPNRYVAVTTVEAGRQGGGSRTKLPSASARSSSPPTNGFLLNGKRVPINGVCNHHDLGALGTAINTRALERQMEILKEMGCNAIRTSHNPPAPELLDLCDRMGFVVMDEAFDCWQSARSAERLSPALRRLAREGSCARWCAATAIIRA